MNKLIQKIFENRGYTQDFLYEVDNPEYPLLKDIDTLCVRLKEIHDNGLRIVVYPDFDMDGISAGVIGYAGLCELGFRTGLYIPDPTDGYGISQESVADLLAKYPGTNAIISCDTGIMAMEAALYCERAGIDFLVTDHHKQEIVIPASIIVNPQRVDETYPHQICGAFVLWQVIMRYAQLYESSFMQDQIARLKVFAGIGTVSDSMPLLYENRKVVRDAIMICRFIYGDGTTSAVSCIEGSIPYRMAFWGLYDFMKVCAENGVIRSSEDINEGFFGWYLAPIFNSVKRMDSDMNYAFRIFFQGNIGIDNPRHRYAEILYKLNSDRKELVTRKLKELLSSPQPYAPYIYLSDAGPGILGLLSMKLMGLSGLPTFVMTDYGISTSKSNRYSGSGRTPEWFNAITKLHDLDYLFIAGHEHAFGFGVDTETHLHQFFNYLSVIVPNIMKEANIVEFKPDYVIDTVWGNGDINIDLDVFDEYLDEIEDYKPFGKGFEEPKGCIHFRNQDVIEWKRMGKVNEHLKIILPGGLDVICWRQGHLISQKDLFTEHVVYGNLNRSEYMGVMSINFTGGFVEK